MRHHAEDRRTCTPRGTRTYRFRFRSSGCFRHCRDVREKGIWRYEKRDLPASSQIQHAVAIIPEWHADTGDGVQGLEAVDRLPDRTDIPQSQLAITHLRETSGRDPVALTKPDSTAVLGSRVSGSFMCWALLTNIPNTELLVSRGGNQQGTVGAPRLRLHNVANIQGQFWRTRLNIPNLHSIIARGRCQHVFRRGVEEHVADLPARALVFRPSLIDIRCVVLGVTA